MVRGLICALVTAVVFAAGSAAAQPNFSTSRVEVTPREPYAGDVVRYAFEVTNSGTTATYARISSQAPRVYFISAEGDCARAKPDRDGGELFWHEGSFAAGAVLRCTLTVLTRRDADGTRASVATEIRVPPSIYFRVDGEADLRSEPDPHAVRLGPVMVTRAGLVVMALIAVFAAGVPIVMARARGQAGMERFALGAWAAVVIASGFLMYFAGLYYGDWRTYSDYRETTCTVFGSALKISGSGSDEQSYKPLFAVRYAVDGVETYSSGYASPSALNVSTRAGVERLFERFAVGSTHPCWYDPGNPKTVLLVRGPGGAYFFALLPLPVLAIALSMLMDLRRRKEESVQPG